MKYYQLANGDQIPAVGLGTWKSSPEQVYKAVKAALNIGYRHIDCAAIYRNETAVGKALKEAIASGDVQRKDLWITSKLWNNAHRRSEVIGGLQKTLTDLQLDYLDLYLIHWPVALKSEVMLPEKPEDFYSLETVPLSETWQGMEDVLEQGLCRHIGVSNFSRQKLADLQATAKHKPEMNQVESHPCLQQQELLDYCQKEGILFTAYSPLGSSDRPPSLKKADEPQLLSHSVIQEIATRHQATPAQVLIAWALNRNTVAIPKSVNPQRLQENIAAVDLSLTEADMQAIAQLESHYRFVDGTFWTTPGSPYTLASLWDE